MAERPSQPPQSSPDAPSATRLHASIAARVEAIVLTAEREAEAAQRDIDTRRRAAEGEIQRYVREARQRADELVARRTRRLDDVTEELRTRLDAARRGLDELARALDRANRLIGEEATGHAAEPSPAPEPPPAPEPSPAPEPHETRRPPSPVAAERTPAPRRRPRERNGDASAAAPIPEAARLVAIEMAVGGSSREEVDRHLRDTFGLDETVEVLDSVFGPDADASARLSWG